MNDGLVLGGGDEQENEPVSNTWVIKVKMTSKSYCVAIVEIVEIGAVVVISEDDEDSKGY